MSTTPRPRGLFVIRAEQVAAFEREAFDDFIRRMVAHLERGFADEVADLPGPLATHVHTWVADAREWGLVKERFVERYLEICASHPRLRTRPFPGWMRAEMNWPGRPTPWKLDKVAARLRRRR